MREMQLSYCHWIMEDKKRVKKGKGVDGVNKVQNAGNQACSRDAKDVPAMCRAVSYHQHV